MYRVWGSLPFDRADHFAHGVLDAFYPGYADSSYFHDERGKALNSRTGLTVGLLTIFC